jgi:hypothetical protein
MEVYLPDWVSLTISIIFELLLWLLFEFSCLRCILIAIYPNFFIKGSNTSAVNQLIFVLFSFVSVFLCFAFFVFCVFSSFFFLTPSHSFYHAGTPCDISNPICQLVSILQFIVWIPYLITHSSLFNFPLIFHFSTLQNQVLKRILPNYINILFYSQQFSPYSSTLKSKLFKVTISAEITLLWRRCAFRIKRNSSLNTRRTIVVLSTPF